MYTTPLLLSTDTITGRGVRRDMTDEVLDEVRSPEVAVELRLGLSPFIEEGVLTRSRLKLGWLIVVL